MKWIEICEIRTQFKKALFMDEISTSLEEFMHHDSVNDGGIYAIALFFSVVINLFNGMAELSMTIARLPIFLQHIWFSCTAHAFCIEWVCPVKRYSIII